MKTSLFTILLLVSCCTTFSNGKETIRNDNDSSYIYWMTFGMIILPPNVGSVNFSYNFSLGDYFYKVGYQVKGGILSNIGEFGREFKTIDVSIGKRYLRKWIMADCFVGPSYVFGIRSSGGNTEKFKTVGLQIDAQLLFRIANEIGIGFGTYINLNFEQPYTGFNINLTLGNGK